MKTSGAKTRFGIKVKIWISFQGNSSIQDYFEKGIAKFAFPAISPRKSRKKSKIFPTNTPNILVLKWAAEKTFAHYRFTRKGFFSWWFFAQFRKLFLFENRTGRATLADIIRFSSAWSKWIERNERATPKFERKSYLPREIPTQSSMPKIIKGEIPSHEKKSRSQGF